MLLARAYLLDIYCPELGYFFKNIYITKFAFNLICQGFYQPYSLLYFHQYQMVYTFKYTFIWYLYMCSHILFSYQNNLLRGFSWSYQFFT